MLGTTISHYKILEKIGEGGMGTVYRALDTKLNRDVALKILPEQFASDSQRMGRFQREAEVLASLVRLAELLFLHDQRLYQEIGLVEEVIERGGPQVDLPALTRGKPRLVQKKPLPMVLDFSRLQVQPKEAKDPVALTFVPRDVDGVQTVRRSRNTGELLTFQHSYLRVRGITRAGRWGSGASEALHFESYIYGT